MNILKKPTSKEKKLLIEYKKTVVLSKQLFEVAIGTLLGDATLQTQNKGKEYRLKFLQSKNLHREYLFHLHDIFHDFVLSPPFYNEKREVFTFQTISHSSFNELASIFFNNGTKKRKKSIPPNFVENYLTPRTLSYWFMDDGGKLSYNKNFERKGFTFNTHGFSKEEVISLCQGLKNRYGLECWTKLNKRKYIIVISGKSHEIMMKLINPFIIPSMRYKIPFYDEWLKTKKRSKNIRKNNEKD